MSEFKVEVVFALPERQLLKTVVVESGTPVAGVVAQSGLLDEFPDHALDQLALGIWGREVDRQHQVREGDRIEIYRPLELDPREARRQLALSGQTMGSVDSS